MKQLLFFLLFHAHMTVFQCVCYINLRSSISRVPKAHILISSRIEEVFCSIRPILCPFFPFFCTVCLIFVVHRGSLPSCDAFGAFRQEENFWFHCRITTIYSVLKNSYVYILYFSKVSPRATLSFIPAQYRRTYLHDFTWATRNWAQKKPPSPGNSGKDG